MSGKGGGAVGGSAGRTAAGLALVTALSAAAGGALGYVVLAGTSGGISQPSADHAHDGRGEASPHGSSSDPGAALQVRELPPLVANLAGGRSLVRLQSAIVYTPAELHDVEALVAALMGDMSAFLGTIGIADVEGPDGLRRLREDLGERAAIRSEGRVREFIIESLVVQ